MNEMTKAMEGGESGGEVNRDELNPILRKKVVTSRQAFAKYMQERGRVTKED